MSRGGLLLVAWWFVSGLWQTAAAQVQVPVHVLEAPTCPSCAIQRYRIATVRDSGFAGGAILTSVHVTALSDGTYLVHAGGEIMTELFRTDRTGRIVARIGGSGEGPGEYRMPWYAAESDSAYLVYDVRLRRVTHLTKADLRVLQTSRIAASPVGHPLLFPDGRHLMNVDRGPGAHARVMNILSPTGEVAVAFDSAGTSAQRVFALIGDSLVVTANSRDGYRLKFFDTAGRLVRIYERRVPWYPPGSGRPLERGEPGFTHLAELEGRLWVMIGAPDRPPALRREDFGPFWDKSTSWVVVEVIDLETHAVIASARVDGYYSRPVAGGFLDALSRLTETGEHVIDIFGYRLSRAPSRDSRDP
jgi:hypothetical protein